ncbi:radical SAM domain-containing protein, partial [mine drainage metagenome]
ESVRSLITTKEKISGEKWLEDAKLIHRLGMKGNSTITYGHLENYDHIIDHFVRLRDNQLEQPGFISVIPLKFSPDNTPLQRARKVKHEASGRKDLDVISLGRIIAGAAIRNISVYWVALGKLTAQLALRAGGNDLVGTAFSEKVFGATDRKDKTYTSELDNIILAAGKIPVQRDTFYNIIRYS